jgi:hypothetical protein
VVHAGRVVAQGSRHELAPEPGSLERAFFAAVEGSGAA